MIMDYSTNTDSSSSRSNAGGSYDVHNHHHHHRNDDEGERPIGIFNIDSGITKSFKNLQGLFTGVVKNNNNNNNKNATESNDDGSSSNSSSGKRRMNSLLVFCPPTASSVGNDDDDEQRNNSRDIFVAPPAFTNQNAPTMVEQEEDTTTKVDDNRPDPAGLSPTKKGITVTPMIVKKKKKTNCNNKDASRIDNYNNEEASEEEMIPGLAPSTPVLTPVNEGTEEGNGGIGMRRGLGHGNWTTPTAGTAKEGTGGRFFADDSAVTVTSRTDDGDDDDETTTTVAADSSTAFLSSSSRTGTALRLGKQEEEEEYKKYRGSSRHPFISFLRMFVVVILTILAGYKTVGHRSHHVQQYVSDLEDHIVKYATKAKTNLDDVLKQYDVDLDPLTTKVQIGLQDSYYKSQQVLKSTQEEITTFVINTVGDDNIESIFDFSKDVQQVVVLRSEQIVHAVSSIDMEDIYHGMTSKIKTFSNNGIEYMQSTVSDAKNALQPYLNNSKRVLLDIYATADVEGFYQTTVSQFKASTREIVSLLIDYFYRFVEFVIETIGQDNIHQFQQHQKNWVAEIKNFAVRLVSQLIKYYEDLCVSNFLESHGLGSSSLLKQSESDVAVSSNVLKSPIYDEASQQEEGQEVEGIIDKNMYDDDSERVIEQEKISEVDKDVTVFEEDVAEETNIEPELLVPDEGETALLEEEADTMGLAPKVSPSGADDYVPTEMVSDYYDRIVLLASTFQPGDLEKEDGDTNRVTEEEPVVVEEENDDTDTQPESWLESECDTPEGGTECSETPEPIIVEETLEPVDTDLFEDEELEKNEEKTEGVETNDENVDTEQYQESNPDKVADAPTDMEVDSSGENEDENQRIPFILDEKSLNDIKIRMENARARMVEANDDDDDDGHHGDGNTYNGNFVGFFQRFMK